MHLTLKNLGTAAFAALLLSTASFAADAPKPDPKSDAKADAADPSLFTPMQYESSGSVRVGGSSVDYRAIVGTLIVHPKDFDDAPQDKDSHNPTAVAAMSYTAYFKKGADAAKRPIMFLYNGGPGSATMWLHMGSFGPKRVTVNDGTHTPAAPYSVVDNDQSLLDVADLVFIDAPGTGFGRIAGKDAKKAFFGSDADVYAFSKFITQFVTKYNRWNSPKYLFGESYGTPRSAALVNVLQSDENMDMNGVVLLSQILNYSLSIDRTKANPGIDLPYELALPTYAATAWYHHKLPGKPVDAKDLPAFLQQVERFAMGPYAQALQHGTSLDDKTRQAVANQLHAYTGLPAGYILKADLRIDGGQFRQTLQGDTDTTTGRLDSRFSGPDFDPLSENAEYDPQSAGISSAYVSAFNSYARNELGYTGTVPYKPNAGNIGEWDFMHQPPGARRKVPQALNVMPDLAAAMKYNPNLHVMANGGYFDLATTYYAGWYEMHHLPISKELAGHIEYHYYMAGHMVYVNLEALKQLHDNVAAFIRNTDNVK